MSKKCTGCGDDIHPKRLEILPNATRCVKCSTTNKKAGITVMKGEGDHTYTETIIMEHDEFVKLKSQDTTDGAYWDLIDEGDESIPPSGDEEEETESSIED